MKVRVAWVGALLIASGACKPVDDLAVFAVSLIGVETADRSMRDSRSFDPYENTIAPPENSVPFASGNNTPGPGRLNTGQPEMGLMPAPFAQADLLSPVVQNLPNPVPADPASLERGEVLFNRICAVCHGPTGVGAQANIIEKFPLLAAYNISGPPASGYTDGFLYGKIRVGGPIMPAYGHQISHFDRWNIVNYLRVLQRQAGNTPAGAGAE
ncbi:MAG: cytochrome c [Gemmatimonadetes bacterium]|nr:cytochrome c [Gemmatimonadota bacterium]